MMQVRILTDSEQFNLQNRPGVVPSLGLFWLKCEFCLRQERGLAAWMRRVPFECYIPTDGVRCDDGHILVARLPGRWTHTVCRHCAPNMDAVNSMRMMLTPRQPKALLRLIGMARQAARRSLPYRPWLPDWNAKALLLNHLDPLDHVKIRQR